MSALAISAGSAMGLAALLPALGAVAVLLAGRWPNLREALTLLTALATAWLVAGMVPVVAAGQEPILRLLPILPGLTLAFRLEPLGLLFALVASSLWILTSLYAIGYLRGHHEQHQTRFFACFALAIAAALGIAFSGNLLTLFLFYELLTFSTYPLVTHHGTPEALRAGRIYLGILVFTSVGLLLLAILMTFRVAGTLEFQPGGILASAVDDGALPEGWVPLLLALYAFGTGKAALMPFHRWLPNAMVAPTPVSALLHAVAVVKAGVFTILKVVLYVFGLDLLTRTGASQWLMAVAGFTAVATAVIAIAQDNLKARLAYSTISQLAYIVLGAALATPDSALGGGLHIAMHAVGKITLFFCAGAIYVAAHKTRVSELDGLARRMPLTFMAFLLASLSLIGMPPFGGMWSKWFMALGALRGGNALYAGLYMLTSLLAVGYLMPVVVRGFLLPPVPDPHDDHDDAHAAHAHPDEQAHPGHAEAPSRGRARATASGFWSGVREAPALCVVPLCLTALGCVALFVWGEALYRLLLPMVGR